MAAIFLEDEEQPAGKGFTFLDDESTPSSPVEEIKAAPTITGELGEGKIKSAALIATQKLSDILGFTQPSSALQKPFDTGRSLLGTTEKIPYVEGESGIVRAGKAAVNVGNEFLAGATTPEGISQFSNPVTTAVQLAQIPGGQLSRILAAEETPAGSPERFEAGLSTVGLLAAPAVAHGAARLSEVLFPKVETGRPIVEPADAPLQFKPPIESEVIPNAKEPNAAPDKIPVVEGQPIVEQAKEEVQKRDTRQAPPEEVTPPESATVPTEQTPRAKLLSGETQGDLISSTQAEDLKLAGETAIDGDAVTAERAKSEADATAAKEIEAKQQPELNDWTQATAFDESSARHQYEASLNEDYQNYIQNEGGATELLDAIEKAGGLPAKTSEHFSAYKGELSQLHEALSKNPNRTEKISYNKIFRKDSPGSDAVVQSIRARGFDVSTPSDVFDLLRDRVDKGKPVYGQSAKGESLYAVPPGTAQLQKAGSAVMGAAKRVLSAVKNIPKFEDFRRSILNWSARNQKSSGEVFRSAENIRSSIPDSVRREAITNWIQAGGDDAVLQQRAAASKNGKLKAGYEAARSLTPEEKALAGKIRQTYDTLLNRAKAYGIEINEIENYVNQIWKRQPLKEFSASSNRRLSTGIRFAKERYYDSFFHGEQNGLKPETKDISKLLPIYINEVNNAIASKQLVADLSKGKASDGRPLVAPRGSAKVIEAEGDKSGVQLVFPESATKDTFDYKVLEQPALHNWKWVGTAEDGTSTLVKSDLAVHPEAYSHLKNVLGQSAVREWWRSPSENPLSDIPKTAVKFLVDDVQQVGKATMLGFISPFHQVQEATHALGHRVNPFSNIPKIDLSDPAHYDAAQHGLMLLPDRVSANQFREGLDGSSRNLVTNILGKAGGKVGAQIKAWADGYQDYLFHQYIPGLKLKTYAHILERNMERYADQISKKEVSTDQVKYLSAQQSNAAFGHLNYADMGRNPTIQHLMQTFLLAPDFLEARGKFGAQAIKPSLAGREQLAAIATLAATQYILARALNKTLDNDYHWKDPFDVIVGNRRYGLRSVPADIEHAFADTRRFISGRLSPLIGRGLLEGLSGVNYRSEPTSAAETLTNIVSGMVPLTLQPATRGLSETGKDNPVSPLEQLIGSLGLHVSRFSPLSEVYQRAKEWTDEHGKQYGITAERGTYPRSKYQQLRYALEDGNFDAAKAEVQRLKGEEKITQKEMDKRFKMAIEHPFTGTKKTDEIFKKSLDERGKKVLDAAVTRRTLLLDRYHSVR